MRRAAIPVYGVVRNEPSAGHGDIASMHTKFMLFDNDVVLSASYNLHFHLWGGNWENSMTYHSRDASLLYAAVWEALRHGRKIRLSIDPSSRYNLYYSFGAYQWRDRNIRPQDAIVAEIESAQRSILVCMFDLARLKGALPGAAGETDVIEALIRARDRGVRVRIMLNGIMGHSGPEPEPWDKEFPRPLKEPMQRLKDAWMEVFYVHYWDSIRSPLHHKFAVMDETTVITGSYNWYEASTRSDEVLSVVRDERIAHAFPRRGRADAADLQDRAGLARRSPTCAGIGVGERAVRADMQVRTVGMKDRDLGALFAAWPRTYGKVLSSANPAQIASPPHAIVFPRRGKRSLIPPCAHPFAAGSMSRRTIGAQRPLHRHKPAEAPPSASLRSGLAKKQDRKCAQQQLYERPLHPVKPPAGTLGPGITTRPGGVSLGCGAV